MCGVWDGLFGGCLGEPAQRLWHSAAGILLSGKEEEQSKVKARGGKSKKKREV